jgi:hypothetical protein
MDKHKFIIVNDKLTAEKLKTSGFKLVSEINNVYTFINQPPQHFNFDEVDVKKIVYTNILSI